MGLLCCGIWRRRRPEQSVREAETKRRETLQKKMPISQSPEPGVRPETPEKKSEVSRVDSTARPAELGVGTITANPLGPQETREIKQDSAATTAATIIVQVDPPPECVELPADPAPRPTPPAESVDTPEDAGGPCTPGPKQFKPYRGTVLEAIGKQHIPRLVSCPPCLVPGSSSVAPEDKAPNSLQRSATWGEESSKTMMAFFPTRLGFGDPWWPGTDLTDDGTLCDWQTASPTDISITSASDMSPTFSASPLSSEASLPLRDSPDPKPSPLRLKTMSQVSLASTNTSQERNLSPRRSSANINQLLARHVMLESRRQILLKLQEIEQEQEEILETLATMPEE